VCQGTLALQTRADVALAFDLAALGDPAATLAASAERSFLAALGGDCNVPIAALAESHADGRLRLRALVASADGQRIVRTELDVDASGAEESGRRAASAILEQGGAAILAELQAEPSA
jgi:hydroxymethylbilane synthase